MRIEVPSTVSGGGPKKMARIYVYFLVASALFIAGFSCENDFGPRVQDTQRDRGQNVSETPKGSYELKSYGILSQGNWNKTGDVILVDVRATDCNDIEECLSRGPLKEYPGSSQASYDFVILPSGETAKRWDWDRDNGSTVKIYLLYSHGNINTEILEAYAFLLQVGVSLGKVQKSFLCHSADKRISSTGKAIKIANWCHWYKNIFDKDLLVYITRMVDDVEVVSRSDWDPLEPLRDLDTITEEADVVEVHLTYTPCSSREICMEVMQVLRRMETRKHGDLFSNFIFGGDGRVYEGLGWNSTRVNKVMQFHFLVNSQDSLPRRLALSAFSLLLQEGVGLGKITEDFRVDTASIGNRSVAEGIDTWVAWSRKIIGESVAITVPPADGRMTNWAKRYEVISTLRHPAGNVLFTTSLKGVDGIPFERRLSGKTIRSAEEVRSNFYFTGDVVAYEGLGWNMTTTEGQMVFEFLIPDSEAIPSNQSMLVSTFLIREGVKMGYLRADYELTVAEHTSMDFENVVRFWDERIRD